MGVGASYGCKVGVGTTVGMGAELAPLASAAVASNRIANRTLDEELRTAQLAQNLTNKATIPFFRGPGSGSALHALF